MLEFAHAYRSLRYLNSHTLSDDNEINKKTNKQTNKHHRQYFAPSCLHDGNFQMSSSILEFVDQHNAKCTYKYFVLLCAYIVS